MWSSFPHPESADACLWIDLAALPIPLLAAGFLRVRPAALAVDFVEKLGVHIVPPGRKGRSEGAESSAPASRIKNRWHPHVQVWRVRRQGTEKSVMREERTMALRSNSWTIWRPSMLVARESAT